MEMSGVSAEAIVMAATAQGRELQRQAAVMRKTQDIASAQARSLIELVKTATPDGVGGRLNVYA
jgi:hypothetical protein